MATSRKVLGLLIVFVHPATRAVGQASPVVRTLTVPVATDSGVVGRISGIRVLANGNVLISDGGMRRVILLDSSLSRIAIVLSNDSGFANKYGNGGLPGLIPYVADSTVFPSQPLQLLLVISPSGKVVRAMAPPKARDFGFLLAGLQSSGGQPAFDPAGHLVYRGTRQAPPQPRRRPDAVPDSGTRTVSVGPDSAPIVRGNLDARTVDTMAMVRLPVTKDVTIALGGGRETSYGLYNPISSVDEWVLLADGTIALVRGQDYHIDWVSPDGKKSSSPKMPFAWKRLTLADKEKLLDSARQSVAEARAKIAAAGQQVPRTPFVTVDPDDIPDYYPPVRIGQVKADPEGNLWVLPSTSTLSSVTLPGLVYDVVNRDGKIIERVRLPAGRNILAVGTGGVVYMSYSPGQGQTRLERATVIK